MQIGPSVRIALRKVLAREAKCNHAHALPAMMETTVLLSRPAPHAIQALASTQAGRAVKIVSLINIQELRLDVIASDARQIAVLLLEQARPLVCVMVVIT